MLSVESRCSDLHRIHEVRCAPGISTSAAPPFGPIGVVCSPATTRRKIRRASIDGSCLGSADARRAPPHAIHDVRCSITFIVTRDSTRLHADRRACAHRAHSHPARKTELGRTLRCAPVEAGTRRVAEGGSVEVHRSSVTTSALVVVLPAVAVFRGAEGLGLLPRGARLP
jgi:hypothetical protein